MKNAKLSRWAELLLDTGKRNRLVNYQDTKASTVEIVCPDAASIFEKAGGTSSLEVYDPRLEEDEYDIVDAESNNQLSMQGYQRSNTPERMDRDTYISVYSARMKKASQVLLYNSTMKPLAALKTIDKKARTALDETGVNVAYLAFGFIHWKESENSQNILRAPLLLAPVFLRNDTAISPYYIDFTGDDVVVNPTFSYKLLNEYGIKLPEYSDEGLNEYLASIQQIIGKLGWEVSDECKLGIFSFLKINMYKDLMDNENQILKNINILKLLGENVEEPEHDLGAEPVRQGNEIIDLHTVVDADSSQIEAIEMAKSGKSFVLQGPPGTGKSQTITNIIAECLHDGKKVLFVSEKQAALNVVYDKLKKAGLEEFCLELHSHKANKKDVIAELCHTLRLARSGVSSRAEAEVELKAKAQRQLDEYAAELHKERDTIHHSLYQLFEAYSATNAIPNVEYSIPDITAKDEVHLREAESLLEQYVQYVPSIGYDYRKNVWYGYANQDVSYQTNTEVAGQLKTALDGLARIITGADTCSRKYGIDCISLEDCSATHKMMSLASQADIITPAFFETGKLPLIHDALQTLKENSMALEAVHDELQSVFEESFFQIDAKETNKKLTNLYSGFFTRLFNSDYKALMNDLRMTCKSGYKLGYSDAVSYTEKLIRYNDSVAAFQHAEESVAPMLGAAYQGEATDWDQVIAQTEQLETILSCGVDYHAVAEMDKSAFAAAKPVFAELAEEMRKGEADCTPAIDYLCKVFNQEEFPIHKYEINALAKRFSGCLDEMDRVENWVRFSALMDRIKKNGTEGYLTYAIDHNVRVGDIVDGYKRVFYRQWIESIIRTEPVLANFTRVSQDQAVHTFAQKDTLQFEISKAQIKAELSAKRPSLDFVSPGSAISILLREGEKKRKQKSIRQLLDDTGELVQVLKPCFLMSPLSVSTFLANGGIHFDTVVFDEASQIFPQDAVGAIYRSEQMIVVGDSKQMPPSNFFNASVDSDNEDEDVGDITDFESILDLCATSLPQLRLSWHYRSRFEQLIAFSNKNFYDNTLVSFPSAQTDKTGIGVDYYYVDGGLFDRQSHTNRAEAEYIVNLIYKNADVFPNRSLGVVAFSVAQQDLIDRLLTKKRIEDPSKEAFFSQNQKEPFFIKNLETVQGDERDTIIFSIAYGKDSQGRLLHNFGPLNRVGGERRLNVAVSRAKCNVQVVSSMHYADIDLSRTQSDGARLLREYLDYAENGMLALERSVFVNPFEQFDSSFEMEVYDFLKAKGYDADTQVGCSGYKIDIGLKRPNSSDYVLAIECDGATYHSSKNARDRDRLRQSILEGMGWRFYRIWSTDWFKNKQIEKERLVEACENALSGGAVASLQQEVREADADSVVFEEKAEEQHFQFPTYKAAPNPTNPYRLQDAIYEIMTVEAPISEEWLLKRIVYLFGREKVTNVVWDKYKQIMWNCAARGIIRRDGFLYLKGQTEYVLRIPGDYKRDIKYIALEELAAGIYTLVEQNITADKEGVFTTLTNLLGFSRRGDAIRTRLNAALALLDNVIKEEDGMLSLK